MKKIDIKIITEAGIMIAMSTVLSMIKLMQMPQGGSVTAASMLPLIFFAMRYGVKKGMIVGALYGFLQMILDMHIYSPIQALLDYPLAYSMLGLAGFAKNRLNKGLQEIILPILAAILMRGLFHVISGVVFFYEYAGSQNPVLYSLSYNGTFLAVEFVITTVILFIIWKPVNKMLDRSRKN